MALCSMGSQSQICWHTAGASLSSRSATTLSPVAGKLKRIFRGGTGIYHSQSPPEQRGKEGDEILRRFHVVVAPSGGCRNGLRKANRTTPGASRPLSLCATPFVKGEYGTCRRRAA